MQVAVLQMDLTDKTLSEIFHHVKKHLDSYQDQDGLRIFSLLAGPLEYCQSRYGIQDFQRLNQEVVGLAGPNPLIFESLNDQGQRCICVAKNGALVSCLKDKDKLAIDDFEAYISLEKEDYLVQPEDWLLIFSNRPYNKDDKSTLKAHRIICQNVSMYNDGRHFWGQEGRSGFSHRRLAFQEGWVAWDQEPRVDSATLLDYLSASIQKLDKTIFSFSKKWIVGLSGGMDSSVVLALLAYSLGPEKLMAVNLPSQYNSQEGQGLAFNLAKNLNVSYRVVPIEALVEESHKGLSQSGFTICDSLTQENIQARLRGHLLYSIASVEKGLVTNNTNKVENFFGYGTLYGDTVGALAFLADLSKVEISDLGHQINRAFGKEVLSTSILFDPKNPYPQAQFMPSAELKHQQVDPMKWGYHDYLMEVLIKEGLEQVLASYLEKTLLRGLSLDLVRAYQLNQPDQFLKDLDWVLTTAQRNVFKRSQHPPMMVLSDWVLGLDKIESQGRLLWTSRALALRKEIENE